MKKVLAATAALICVPGVAAAQDMAGPRIEARLGYETPTVSGDGEVYKIGSAVSYGGEVGFDIAVSEKVLVGPYANYEFSSVELCDGGDCLGEKGNLSVGGRIGFVAGGKTVIYAKAGYANITIEATSGGATGSESKGGVQGALGVELGFSKQFYGMVEMSYADYGAFYDFNLQRRQVAAGLGVRF